MAADKTIPDNDEVVAVSDEALQKAESFVEAEEGAANRLMGWAGKISTAIAVVMSLFHLYAAYAIVPTQELRYIHVAFTLVLSFLLFPLAMRFRNRVRWWDIVPGIVAVATIVYALWGGDDFTDRATMPDRWDVIVGIVFIILLLEATRRTTGAIMPVVSLLFIAYAMLGPHLPAPWTHRGYDVDRLVGHLFITLEGIFGVAVDVSATLIILFTIYGAFLQQSGAGKFFIDFSLALMGGKPNSAGRTVVLSSFLLGGPSGSGVATTVMIGTVAYPMMAKAGFEKNAAGGLLAAGGLGAILSPPVLGAAAFLIAEFLKISYLDVIWMATIPTCLYYMSLLFMVELDAKKFHAKDVMFTPEMSLGQMTRRYGFHFISLLAVVVFMIIGYSPSLSVFYAIVVTFALSFLRKETALMPAKLVKALADGSIGALNAATTCACAGIVVGIVTLTGLGLKFSAIVISYAGGSLLLTAIYTSLIVWIIGLAVPVTASYIICAVIAAPALIKLGVPDYAAHMFIFYYAVLSEVSPPTALSPFAAAAITGGDPYKTTLQSWKYTLPAFLVPFVFVLDPQGVGLLLSIPKGGSWVDILEITIKTTFGLLALAAFAQNWALRQNTPVERGLLLLSGLLLVFPSLIEAIVEWIIGRDISYTYVPGPDHRSRRIAVAGPNAVARAAGANDIVNEGIEETKMKKTTAILAMTLGLAVAGAAYAQQKTMSIGTGGTGGVYYPLGGAVANVLSKSLPNVQATAEVTGGSVDNLKLIGAGKSELGFTMADAALDALNGEDKFKSGKLPLQALLVVYPNRMHVVTVEGTGINSMADLKGKRVSTGSPGGATEVMAFRVIEAAGLDKDKDMKRERLGVAESVNAIKDRKIDAFFWVGGIPTAAVTDLAATPGMKMKLVDHGDLAEKMNAKYGKLYTASKIKAGSYPGYDKDNSITEVWNLIVTGDKMSNDDAYTIVKTLVEKKADIVAVHKEAESFSLDNQVQERSPIPFHPGALKYFKEKGIGK